jgi:hypothetical protein
MTKEQQQKLIDIKRGLPPYSCILDTVTNQGDFIEFRVYTLKEWGVSELGFELSPKAKSKTLIFENRFKFLGAHYLISLIDISSIEFRMSDFEPNTGKVSLIYSQEEKQKSIKLTWHYRRGGAIIETSEPYIINGLATPFKRVSTIEISSILQAISIINTINF